MSCQHPALFACRHKPIFAAAVIDEELDDEIFFEIKQKALQFHRMCGHLAVQNGVLQIFVHIQQQQKNNQQVMATASLRHRLQLRDFIALFPAKERVCQTLQGLLHQISELGLIWVLEYVSKKIACVCLSILTL